MALGEEGCIVLYYYWSSFQWYQIKQTKSWLYCQSKSVYSFVGQCVIKWILTKCKMTKEQIQNIKHLTLHIDVTCNKVNLLLHILQKFVQIDQYHEKEGETVKKILLKIKFRTEDQLIYNKWIIRLFWKNFIK